MAPVRKFEKSTGTACLPRQARETPIPPPARKCPRRVLKRKVEKRILEDQDKKLIFESKISTTQYTWIKRKLGEGLDGRKEVNRYLMGVYYEPLQIYFKGCRLNWLSAHHGGAQDVVHGFFQSRLSREHFFADWQQSHKRLRTWVVGAFWHYLYELRNTYLRNHGRFVQGSHLDEKPTRDDHVQAFDKAVAISIVQETLRRARTRWEARNQGKHWQVLVKRFYEKLSYREIGTLLDMTEAKARKLAQTAREKFRGVLEETVANEVKDPLKVKEEIRLLLESLNA